MRQVSAFGLLLAFAGGGLAFSAGAADAFYGCDTRYEFSAANQKLAPETCNLVEGAGREAGKNAFRLRTPATVKGDLLFFPIPQTSVEDVGAAVTVSGWFRGDARFTFGIGTYDQNHRNVYPMRKHVSETLEIKPEDGWKEFSFTFVPLPGDPYTVAARFVMPTVRVRSGGELFADDISLTFAKPERPCVQGAARTPPPRRCGVSPHQSDEWRKGIPLEPATEFSFADTTVTVESVGKSALFTFRLADRDVADAVARALKDPENVVRDGRAADRPAWMNDGIELFLGNKAAHLHFAFDFRGRLYTDVKDLLWTKADWTKEAFTFRLAVPYALIPTDPDCTYRAFVTMYRKDRRTVTPLVEGCKNFHDMSQAKLIPLAGEKRIAADLAARAKEAAELAARIEKIKRENGAGNGGALGDRPLPCLAEEETMATIPEAWRPAKINGKDYRVLLGYPLFKDFKKLGIGNEDPLIADAILWAPWGYFAPQDYLVGGWTHDFLKAEPDRMFAVKTIDIYGMVDRKSRSWPSILAMYDKRFMDYFFDTFGGQFLGFWEDEAFINATGMFRRTLDAWKIPIPTNRDEAYAAFKTCYSGLVSTNIPERTSFRNLANNCAYCRGRIASVAASSFNPYVSALGDVMSGNETGDCMGPASVMFAFARGAARQWGRPWRNYQTYYGWRYLQDKVWGGRSNGPRNVCMNAEILSPKCRHAYHGFLNTPVYGTDRARQKATHLAPFFWGASVWSSEAHHEESFAWYDENETVDPSVLPLRDPKFQTSYMMETQRRFWREIVRKRDRGVGVTPIAFVWDRANGYASSYFGPLVWDFFTPNEMEKTMWALLEDVYPAAACGREYTGSPYGNVFDQVTNDAKADFLKTYRVLYLVADCRLDATTVKNVSAAVRAGSTLVVNAELLAKYPNAFAADFLGVEVTDGTGTSRATYSRLGGEVIKETGAYDYRVVKPLAGTDTLAFTTDEATAPAITMTRVGKGRVIVTTPAHLKVKGSMDSMLKLFGHLMTHLRDDALAIRVTTPMSYAVARSGTSWLVYFNNNDGIPPLAGIFEKLPVTDVTKTAKGTVTIPVHLGKVTKVVDWWTGGDVSFTSDANGATASVTLPGGDCCVLEFVVK